MYRIAILKIWLQPDSIGYQTNYLAGTGHLNTSCKAIFWVFQRGKKTKRIIPRAGCFELSIF